MLIKPTEIIEQKIADWFAYMLAKIDRAYGYSITLRCADIHVNGVPESRENPPAMAEYDDDVGGWEELKTTDLHAALLFAPKVKITVVASEAEYKRVSRAVWADVMRACNFDPLQTDAPPGILLIKPTDWNREEPDGNYIETTITFTVRAHAQAFS